MPVRTICEASGGCNAGSGSDIEHMEKTAPTPFLPKSIQSDPDFAW